MLIAILLWLFWRVFYGSSFANRWFISLKVYLLLPWAFPSIFSNIFRPYHVLVFPSPIQIQRLLFSWSSLFVVRTHAIFRNSSSVKLLELVTFILSSHFKVISIIFHTAPSVAFIRFSHLSFLHDNYFWMHIITGLVLLQNIWEVPVFCVERFDL